VLKSRTGQVRRDAALEALPGASPLDMARS
jgi:hypothetical protein